MNITKEMIEAGAKALVPFSYGAFEYQRDVNGNRVQPAGQPNDHASMASEAVLTAALHAKAGVSVEVKELVWVKPRLSNTLSRCDTELGTYRTWTHHEANGKWFWSLEGGCNEVSGEADTESAVQAAAQADYEARIRSALSTKETTMERLGRFGHHPDPANDFCIEAEALVGLHFDALYGISKPGTEPITMAEVQERIDRAMDFTVGGDEIAVKAKATLRALSTKLQEPAGVMSDEQLEKAIAAFDMNVGNGFRACLSAALATLAHQPVTAGLEKAIAALTDYQQQLDQDGIMVGVSREALEMVLAALKSEGRNDE